MNCAEYSRWIVLTVACLAGFAGFSLGMAVMHYRIDRRNAKSIVG